MEQLLKLNEDETPYERLLNGSMTTLKDYELLTLILGSGVQGMDVLALCEEIAALFESGVDMLDVEKLASVQGVGMEKAVQILASVELGRRHLLHRNIRLVSSEVVSELLRAYAMKRQEHFLTLTVDNQSRLIEERVVMSGTLNHALVHPRDVFAEAVSDKAEGIIVAHIHPRGRLMAGTEDMQVMHRLKDVGKLVGIELMDYVVMTRNGTLSFREKGIL